MRHISVSRPALLAVATGVGAAVLASGLTASNSVIPVGAGDGTAAAVGYAIIGRPSLALSDENPQEVASVTFTLDPAPSDSATLRVKVGSLTTTWHDCIATGLATLTCPVAGTSAFDADELRVVVAD